ncbi:hypothetical protein LCGC14_0231370 [marine sediment metagenome]|uniref:Uncharacterized protein n=1 Tax=marine sediment metagenome TaxID=412755 RepID=A0A0F9UA06_9ZZZZ
MGKFDKDIQADYDEQRFWSLALLAQDLRDTLEHVAPRALVAALKRKRKAKASPKRTDGDGK